MEEGSLLQEALDHMERMRNGQLVRGDGDGNDGDVLQLDVYDLEQLQQPDRILRLQKLAQLACEFNTYIQSKGFLWHSGFPPVFGIHVTNIVGGGGGRNSSSNHIPHLRAMFRYGDNVGDEWMAIRYMMELSKLNPTVAIDCWDMDVGPIMLIEASDGLPDWLCEGQVDEQSRYNCWIVNGMVTLIGPTREELTLATALESLRIVDRITSTPPQLQAELSKTIQNDALGLQQRTALVLPRSIARILKHVPNLANAAAVAHAKCPTPVMAHQYEDWVWTTCALARTNYAMLRTVLPKERQKLTVELKRIQRACANEATPHLAHALEMGMHLTAGLQSLLGHESNTTNDRPSNGMSPMERRILQYWTSTDIECGGDGLWLQQAWQLGPKNSPYDMAHILRCPVFKDEHEYPSPASHAGVTSQEMIRTGLKQKPSKEEKFVVPRSADVDHEEWIHRGEDALEEAFAKRGSGEYPDKTGSFSSLHSNADAPNEDQLDSLLGGFQQFMDGESEIGGIAHTESSNRERPGLEEPLHINPRVFLNLLRDVLKLSPKDLERRISGVQDDPFFSKEDYDLMEPDVAVDQQNDSDGSEQMEAIMEAMDAELTATSASRARETGELQDIPDQSIATDARALSNLMQSLGASDGAPGPIVTIMKEMGVDPPKIRSDDMVDVSSSEEADSSEARS